MPKTMPPKFSSALDKQPLLSAAGGGQSCLNHADTKPRYIRLPKTSLTHYISFMPALNIPTGSCGGDWHFYETFYWGGREYEEVKDRFNLLCGEGERCNTNSFWGSQGILECSELVSSLGLSFEGDKVYVASFSRAAADLVLLHTQNTVPYHLKMDELTPGVREQQQITEYLNLALKSKSLEDEQKMRILKWQELQKMIF